jgi:tetratricopeptide (TPR) repeat protein
MEWQQVTQSFLPLTREQTAEFASPREMDLAIASYNRAIRNLSQDSSDIALIALRKLTADYPRFHEAALLYGCTLAQEGELQEALQQLQSVSKTTGLPDDLAAATAAALQMVEVELDARESQPHPAYDAPATPTAQRLAAAAALPVGAKPVLLERTGRRKAMRMASERERRQVMRQGDMPQHEETNVVMPRTGAEILRSILPVALIVLIAGVVVFLGIRLLPGLFTRAEQSDAQQKLDYLLAEMQAKSASNPELQSLLADYKQKFPDSDSNGTNSQGLPVNSSESTPATITDSTADSPTTIGTPATVPTTAVTAPAMPTTTASTLPTTTTIAEPTPLPTQPAPSPSATIDDPRKAALALRHQAQPIFEAGDYTAALPLYLQAYELDPRSYGGGVAYYVGRCYQLLEQPEKARPYFEYVVKEFSGRDIASSAASRLREIGD